MLCGGFFQKTRHSRIKERTEQLMFWNKKKKNQETVQVDDRLQHIAFIMDGNGRWARKRGMPREFGHTQGASTFRKIGLYCQKIGVKYMTVYAYSTENWKRPEKEVKAIMKLFDDYIEECFVKMEGYNIHFRFIGNLSIFPDSLRAKMERIERETEGKPFLLNIAVNYGGREEIAHACTELIRQGKETVTEEDISKNLYTLDCPDPDLIVRTGGDLRTSNFLLWQSAYAEYYFTDVLWPDLSERDVDDAVSAFYGRKRRYGGI